jgi:hypothetical protein
MNTKQHGRVTLNHGHAMLKNGRFDWYQVKVDGRMVCETQDHTEARRVANFCFKHKTTPAADIIAAYVVSKTRDPETAWGMVNLLLGCCADGCCGGVDRFEPNSKEFNEYTAWANTLCAALSKELKGVAA